MLNAIWDSTAEVLQKSYGRFSLVDVLLPMSALSQFPSQEDPWIKGYRYWCIFNNNTAPVYLKDVFIQRMGTSYEDFLMLGYFLQLMFLAQAEEKRGTIPIKVLEY